MPDYAQARLLMVETQLRTREVNDHDLISAMLNVPRERFVPAERMGLAYSDMRHEFAGASRRVMPEPVSFALLAQLGAITRDDVVLDIACGTGYSTAVLAGIASAVVALEDDDDLVAAADANLTALEIGNAAVLRGDLRDGVPSEAPFDVILIGGAVDAVSPALFNQLKEGGRLVVGTVHGPTSVATLFIKTDGKVTRHEAFDLGLPRLEAFAKPVAFAL